MSWLLDMNFAWTFRQVKERKFLEKMAAQLPPTELVQQVTAFLAAYRDRRIAE
jgi:hypothetical protein